MAIGAFISSLSADMQGALLLAYVYMAAVTNETYERTFRMILLEMAIFSGQGLGSLIAGLLLQYFGFTAAFVYSASLGLICLLFVAFILPPVPPSNSSSPIEGADCTGCRCTKISKQFSQIRDDLKTFFDVWIKGRNMSVILLLFAAFFTIAAYFGEAVMLPMFLKHTPLNLNAREIGLFLLLLYAVRVVGVAVLGIITYKLIHPPDYILIIIGLINVVVTEF